MRRAAASRRGAGGGRWRGRGAYFNARIFGPATAVLQGKAVHDNLQTLSLCDRPGVSSAPYTLTASVAGERVETARNTRLEANTREVPDSRQNAQALKDANKRQLKGDEGESRILMGSGCEYKDHSISSFRQARNRADNTIAERKSIDFLFVALL